MSFLKDLRDKTQNLNFMWVFLITGIIVLVSSFIWFEDNNVIFKIGYTLGTTFIASGVFAAIAKSNQFAEIFSKILRDIIYGQEHLENRKDLESIWENVTLTLSNRKFLKISDELKDNVKKYFLPLTHDYYYEGYKTEIIIEIDKKNPDYVVLKESVKFNIICDDENLEIKLNPRRGIKFDQKNKDLTSYKLHSFTIDDKTHKLPVNEKYEGNIFWVDFEVTLKGSKKYTIKREEEIIYNIKYDQLRTHRANWVYKGMEVSITYPIEIYIDFNMMGTLRDYNVTSKKLNSFKKIDAEYKGLIYKNQGFFYLICKKH